MDRTSRHSDYAPFGCDIETMRLLRGRIRSANEHWRLKARGASLGDWRVGPVVVERAKGVEAIQCRANGFADQVRPIIAELQANGSSLREIVAELSRRGIRTCRDALGRGPRYGA